MQRALDFGATFAAMIMALAVLAVLQTPVGGLDPARAAAGYATPVSTPWQASPTLP